MSALRGRRSPTATLVALGLVAGGMAGATVAFIKDLDDGLEYDRSVREQLRKIAELDAALDVELLLARFGMAPSYDALVETRQLLAGAVAQARVLGAHGAPLTDPSLTNAFAAMEQAFDERDRLIERVKTKRAAVGNSSHFLPVVMQTAQADASATEPTARRHLSALEVATLQVALTPTEADYARLREVTEVIAADKALTADHPVKNAAHHARTLLERQTLDLATEQAIGLNTGSTVEALRTAYENQRNTVVQRGATTRSLLFVLSAALVAAVAVVLRRLAKLNASARRFVPYEFLEMLGKGSLADIKRGDAVEKEMSVVFADIRDFTKKSAKRNPQENFKFMNEYLGAMEGPIQAHGGFVNQYLGDGLMALFPRSADDAISAGAQMFTALEDLNRELGDDAVRIGIGVNTGQLMLGTLGGRDHMNAGVISDAVNLASRMEGLTKHYGVRMLLSEHTHGRASSKAKLARRMVDRVRVKGGDRPINVFQVVDVEEAELREQLRPVLPVNEQAFERYFQRQFNEAKDLFAQVAAAAPADPLAKLMIERCRGFAITPPPANWDGATLHDAK